MGKGECRGGDGAYKQPPTHRPARVPDETGHDGDTVINRINQRTVALDRDNDAVSFGRISTG
jgi:hypothetical protein